ncbi:ubiquitin-conjugating enzyme E2 J1 [Lampetra fluviatilis]
MESRYSLRSPAVKRLMKEAQELREPTQHYFAQPLEDNLFEWHFSVRGPPDSDFEGGIYHGRIILPPEYPMRPPSIIMLTASGRFEVGKKICLSISGHHPETWQPSWSIRTALLALIGFMPTKGEGAIGSLDYSAEERRQLAKRSREFVCEGCGERLRVALPEAAEGPSPDDSEAHELARQISFKPEATGPGTQPSEGSSSSGGSGGGGGIDSASSGSITTTGPSPSASEPQEESGESGAQRLRPPSPASTEPRQRVVTTAHHRHHLLLFSSSSSAARAGDRGEGPWGGRGLASSLLVALLAVAIAFLVLRRALLGRAFDDGYGV